jgi:hypothetical protein
MSGAAQACTGANGMMFLTRHDHARDNRLVMQEAQNG